MSIELLTVDSGTNKGTISALLVDDIVCCWALELPWNNNEESISCIPAGSYDLVLEWSPKYKMMLYEIKGVKGRTECKFHIANYLSELEGCVAVGVDLGTTGRSQYCVRDSKIAFDRFMVEMAQRKTDKLLVANRPTL